MPPESTTAPAPAAPAAPAAAPAAPAPKTESSPFSALDTRARTLPAKKEAETTEEPPKGEDNDIRTAFEDDKPAGDKPAEKPAEKPAAQPAKPQVEAPKVLRERLESANKELETSRKELTTLREKIADYDRRNIDSTALSAKLEAQEKEYKAIKAERDAANWQKSEDFKTKFEKPFTQAVGYAKEVVAAMTVTHTNAETGEVTTTKPTWEDFADIYRMSPARREIEARKVFGDNFMIVMRHIDKLGELDRNKADALTEYQAQATQRETQQVAEQAQQRERTNQAWQMTNQDIIKGNPDWYGERKDDEEGNALWNESLALVDQAYTGRDKLTDQQRIVLDANIRLRAAAFPRMSREIEMLKARVAEFEEQKQQTKDSRPGAVKRPVSGEQAPAEVDWRQDLRKSVGTVPG